MKREQKSLTNKGFSLVELIIVVAIMAVLIGVLAPQYLRYVEKARLQRDNTSIADFANVVKISSTEEKVNAALASGATFEFNTATPPALKHSGVDDLDKEVDMTVAYDTTDLSYKDVKLTSNTYNNATDKPKLVVTVTNGIVSVTCENWYDTPPKSGEDSITKTF